MAVAQGLGALPLGPLCDAHGGRLGDVVGADEGVALLAQRVGEPAFGVDVLAIGLEEVVLPPQGPERWSIEGWWKDQGSSRSGGTMKKFARSTVSGSPFLISASSPHQ